MGMIRLRATMTSDTATTMSLPSTGTGFNSSPGYSGLIMGVTGLASADSGIALVIADEVGTVFTIGSTDFTTRKQYKNSATEIVRDAVTGRLTCTPTGIGSGNLVVDLYLAV